MSFNPEVWFRSPVLGFLFGDEIMSTDYYALKKPITSIRPEIMGGHTHVGIWVNHAKSGTLVFRNDEWNDAIWLFVEKNVSTPPMRSFWGGVEDGCVVEEADNSLPAEQQMISELGELMTVGQIRAKAKSYGYLSPRRNQHRSK